MCVSLRLFHVDEGGFFLCLVDDASMLLFLCGCMCSLVRLSAGQRACPVAHHRVPAVRSAPVPSYLPARDIGPRQERREASKIGCQECVDLCGR
jgi:hypothetical protein